MHCERAAAEREREREKESMSTRVGWAARGRNAQAMQASKASKQVWIRVEGRHGQAQH